MLKNYRQLFKKMMTKKCWYDLQKMLTKKCSKKSKKRKMLPDILKDVATFKKS
jgi:hypothetical protein